MGETGNSRFNLCLDGHAEKATIPNEFRESCQEAPRFEIRAENGRIPSAEGLFSHSTGYSTVGQCPEVSFFG